MQVPDTPPTADEPDLDLVEYVLVTAPAVAALAPVAAAVVDLVGAGSIRLVDVVVLVRPQDRAGVLTATPGERGPVSGLAGVADTEVLLSAHDVELAAVTLDPGEAALLLLVEDRWATTISAAARSGGARVSAGERITRDRVQAALGSARAGEGRSGRADLFARGPSTVPLVDQAAQVQLLARLVDGGVLPLDRYEAQRRRVLEG